MSTTHNNDANDRFNRCVRIRQVCEMTAMSRASIYRKVVDGSFPKPFKIGVSISAWRIATIEAWIAERERQCKLT